MMCGVGGCYLLRGSGVFSGCALEPVLRLKGCALQEDTHSQAVTTSTSSRPVTPAVRAFRASLSPAQRGNGACMGLPVSIETC